MRSGLAFVGVGVVVACVETSAVAEETTSDEKRAEAKGDDRTEPSGDSEAREEAVRDAQVFRVNVGGSLGNLNAGGLGGGVGTVGALGPTVRIDAGPRLAGPLWVAFGVEGSVFDTGAEAQESTTVWGVGGTVALHVDVPILPKVEIGGSLTPRVSAQVGPSWEELSVSAHLGVGLHLRPTNFFGIRTAVELARVGYARFETTEGEAWEVLAAEIHAGPSVGLTFSF